MRDNGAEAYANFVRMCKEVWHCPAMSREAYEKETKPLSDSVVNVDAVLKNSRKKKDKICP